MLHSLIVKNFPDISGWHRSTCLDKLDVGELLWDLTILVERHKLHLNCKLKPLFFPLSDANRLKNSEKWSNLCLNLASCSSSATILLQKKCFSNYSFFKDYLLSESKNYVAIIITIMMQDDEFIKVPGVNRKWLKKWT